MTGQEKYIIPNLKNSCIVLKYLASASSGNSIAEIQTKLNIPHTTLLRILTTLRSEDMVALKEKRYFLGNALIQLGIKAMDNLDLKKLAEPELHILTKKTQETAHIAVLSGTSTLIVHVQESPHPVSAASQSGATAPLHCSSTGKVFMAYILKNEIEELLNFPLKPRTKKTLTTIDEIKKDIKKTIKQGYGYDNEEYAEGVRCLAAPIKDAHGEVIAAIGITAGTATFTEKRKKFISEKVKDAAEKISGMLGAV